MKRKILSMALGMMLCLPIVPATAETVPKRPVIEDLVKAKDTETVWGNEIMIDLETVSDGLLLIEEAGEYVLSGTLQGQVRIEVPVEEKVHLILSDAAIESPEGPAIYEVQADKLVVTLEAGTENVLTSSVPVTDGDDTISAALYAEDDLSLNGDGMLKVTSEGHGIQSKADLVIASGKITVSSGKDAVRGRNSVLVLDGTLDLTAGGDGIVSTREDKDGKGWVILAGGTVSIETGGGAGEAKTVQRMDMRGRGQAMVQSADAESQKGVKAATDLTILSGTLTLNCRDDALHAENVTLFGGTLSVATGDDGAHADNAMTVVDGSIDIGQCYEGLEGMDVTVLGGQIRIVASDDGINAAGGNDASGFGGRGQDRFAGGNNTLTILGGTLQVTAGGDGLDSNGSIAILGGEIGLWTATTMGDGAIDFNGTGTVTGGTLIMATTNGVMRDTAGMTGQAMMSISVGTQRAGTEIQIKDTDGKVLAAYTPEKDFDTVIVSSQQLPEGTKYVLTCEDTVLYEGEMQAQALSVSNFGGRGGFGGMNGEGGGRMRQRRW